MAPEEAIGEALAVNMTRLNGCDGIGNDMDAPRHRKRCHRGHDARPFSVGEREMRVKTAVGRMPRAPGGSEEYTANDGVAKESEITYEYDDY